MFKKLGGVIVKKSFTIIELLAVLAIIGIIAAMIIPNISNIRKEANVVAIHSDIRNIQTAVDMYNLNSMGNYPTLSKPTKFIPEPIDFTLLHPDYLRVLPNIDGAKYWVDFQGQVWASTVDSAIDLRYVEGGIIWKASEGAAKYQVFVLEGNDEVIGSTGNSETPTTLKGRGSFTNFGVNLI